MTDDTAPYGWLVRNGDRMPAGITEAVDALQGRSHRLTLFGLPAKWEASPEVVETVKEYIEAEREDWTDGLYRRRR